MSGINLCADATPQTLHVDGVDWHGTAVASVLAAAADGSGMVGMAPGARVMAVRRLEPACSTVSYAVNAIEYAIAGGAMPTAPSNGAVRVYVDGVRAGTLHLHAARTHPRRVVFRRVWAASGTHTIRLVVVGGGSHPRVDLDAILIGR